MLAILTRDDGARDKGKMRDYEEQSFSMMLVSSQQ